MYVCEDASVIVYVCACVVYMKYVNVFVNLHLYVCMCLYMYINASLCIFIYVCMGVLPVPIRTFSSL